MRRITVILALLICFRLGAQEITVLPHNGGGLSVDLDYLWRYNLYEHSRWGVGLAYNADSARSWRIVGNAGYGLHDKQLKWGVGTAFLLNSNRHGTLYFFASRDYSAAGNCRMQWASITDPGGLSSFMSLRMSDQHALLAGYRWHTPAVACATDVRLFFGGRLFDNNGLLYRINGDTIDPENGVELRFSIAHGGFAAMLHLGHTWPAHKPIAQLLAEYNNTFQLQPFAFHFHTQAGITPPNTPYIYMFNLGGTLGSPLFFRNTLLTVRPCEYTANLSVVSSSYFRLKDPLFTLHNSLFVIGTAPRPFVGLTAAWGMMWGQAADGTITYEGLDLQAPVRGVAEAVLGIDGLLRWGPVDYGAAIALGFIPSESSPRWTLLLTADLAILRE